VVPLRGEPTINRNCLLINGIGRGKM